MGKDKQESLPGVPSSDPGRYRRLQEPFENAEALDVAIEGLHRELGALREKYKIPDIYIVFSANAMTSDGAEGQFMSTLQFGSGERGEALAAYAYGLESARRQERIAAALGSSLKLRPGTK